MSDPIENLMKMEREECPYIGENTQCEEFQGIKCLILKHRDCETYKKLEEDK